MPLNSDSVSEGSLVERVRESVEVYRIDDRATAAFCKRAVAAFINTWRPFLFIRLLMLESDERRRKCLVFDTSTSN